MSDSVNYFCSDCQFLGLSNKVKKGNKKTEVFLWVAFTPVAILYSIYRIFSIKKCCQKCGGFNIIKMNSKLVEEAIIKRQIES